MKHLFNSVMGVFLAMIMTITALQAETTYLKCPNFFADNMVLQREMPVPIWGQGMPGTEVSVSFAGMTKTSLVDQFGHWRVVLDAMPASATNRDLTVTSGDDSLTIKQVLVGEVWLASGQSNMEWPIRRTGMPKAEIAQLRQPTVRIMTVQRKASTVPFGKCREGLVGGSPQKVPYT